jgi:hypothetical protein
VAQLVNTGAPGTHSHSPSVKVNGVRVRVGLGVRVRVGLGWGAANLVSTGLVLSQPIC